MRLQRFLWGSATFLLAASLILFPAQPSAASAAQTEKMELHASTTPTASTSTRSSSSSSPTAEFVWENMEGDDTDLLELGPPSSNTQQLNSNYNEQMSSTTVNVAARGVSKSLKRKTLVVATTALVGIAGGLFVFGGKDNASSSGSKDELSVLLQKEKRKTREAKAVQDLLGRYDVDDATAKYLPSKQMISSQERATQANMIMNDIRAARARREKEMEASRVRVQAIQAELRINDQEIKAKKEAAQQALKRLLATTKEQQAEKEEQARLEQRQQQRAKDVAKSQEKRRQRQEIQRKEDARHREERQKQTRQVEKTPDQIRADQKGERTRRSLMETRYHRDLIDSLMDKRQQRQLALEEEARRQMQQHREKYNLLDGPVVVGSIDLKPRPPTTPVPLEQLEPIKEKADVDDARLPESTEDTTPPSPREALLDVELVAVEKQMREPGPSTTSSSSEPISAVTPSAKERIYSTARALVVTRFLMEENAKATKMNDQKPILEDLTTAIAAEKKQKAEMAGREMMERRFAASSQRQSTFQTPQHTVGAIPSLTKSFQERLLTERLTMESRTRLANKSTVPVPASTSSGSWSERSARNLLQARLAMMIAEKTDNKTAGLSYTERTAKGLLEARLASVNGINTGSEEIFKAQSGINGRAIETTPTTRQGTEGSPDSVQANSFRNGFW